MPPVSSGFVRRMLVVPYGAGNVNGPRSGRANVGRDRVAVDVQDSTKPQVLIQYSSLAYGPIGWRDEYTPPRTRRPAPGTGAAGEKVADRQCAFAPELFVTR